MGRTRPPRKNSTREVLAKQALTAALRTRRNLGLSLHEAVCVYDAAQELGVEVRFDAIPSMEGMYVKQTLEGVAPHILVSALRPAGRQAMTAAHELGHHVFGHGTHIDQYVKGVGTIGNTLAPAVTHPNTSLSTFDPKEFLADCFGAFFLMPKSAVERGFATRGISPAVSTDLDLFGVAGWLGVGYTTLIHHMYWSIKLIDWAHAQELLTAKPKTLRERLLGDPFGGDVYMVDGAWTGRPVDLKVGDVAIVPRGTSFEVAAGEGPSLSRTPPGLVVETQRGTTLFEATSVGLGRLFGDGWAAFVRVSEREYAGRSRYRHLEPASDE
jgi:hypothetical protein